MRQPITVITGGGRGIGRAFTLALARAGSRVVVTGRTAASLDETVQLVRQQGGEALAVACDVADGKSVAAAFAGITRRCGPIDVLVNNAGVPGAVEAFWKVDPDAWWRTQEINLRGCFLCAHAVLPGMIERRSGRIINIASHAGVYRWPYCSDYSVSKAALIKMTENVAVEVRKQQVAVFAFHPGFVKGGFSDSLPEVDPPPDSPAGKVLAWTRQELASPRAVTPEQAAAGVVKLASGKYDALSGRYVTVHDDLDALLAAAPAIQKADALTLRLKEVS